MEQYIRSIKEHFLEKLNDQRSYFTPEQLIEAGLPDFLVKRVKLELMRNLQDSVRPPESDWADMSTDAVREAWDSFLQAIHEEIRLPASYAGSVLESVLGDMLELMVTPRAFLPEYIFGSENELDLESIRDRCEWVVVYTYFPSAILRFMEKKGRKVLTKAQADRIIERLDERVTAHYTSLNWAQLFDPWFALMGERIDPGLFAGFFRDKGKPGVARLFDAEQDSVNRNKLIEILSKPHLDEIDSEIDDISNLHGGREGVGRSTAVEPRGKYPEDADTKASPIIPAKEQSYKPERIEDTEKAKGGASVAARNDDEDNILGKFQKTNGGDADASPLHSSLRPDPQERDDDSQSIYSRLGSSMADDQEPDDVPIWKRFTKDRNSDRADDRGKRVFEWAQTTGQLPTAGQSPSNKIANAPGQTQRPGQSDASGRDHKNADDGNSKLNTLRSYVTDMEDEFVDQIFGGDENAFLEALENISRFKSWKEAGAYISSEVFNRNLIDLYSDAAIYFTDRMQTYFLEMGNES